MDSVLRERICELGKILNETEKGYGGTGVFSVEYSHCPPSEEWGVIDVHVHPENERSEAKRELEKMYLSSRDRQLKKLIKKELRVDPFELFELKHPFLAPITAWALGLGFFVGIPYLIYRISTK